MALSGNVSIDITQLREGDGSLKMALELWSIRNGPAPYNQWQSVYNELLREHGYSDEYWVLKKQLSKDYPKERQARIRNLYNEIQAELHGPDHQVASLIRGRQDQARAQEEREAAAVMGNDGGARESGVEGSQGELMVGVTPSSCPAALGLPDLSASSAVAQPSGAQEFQLMTPRSRNAVPAAGSPDKSLARPEVEAL